MEITVTKNAVLGLIREILEGNSEKTDPAVVVEPPIEELPVAANPEIEGGPFEMPPISDDEYVPGTPVELAQAAYAVGKQIPSKDVRKFWKALDRLATDAETWQEENNMSNMTVEARLRHQIRQILRETGMSSQFMSEEDVEEPTLSKAEKMRRIKSAAMFAKKQRDIDREFKPTLDPSEPTDDGDIAALPGDAPDDDDDNGASYTSWDQLSREERKPWVMKAQMAGEPTAARRYYEREKSGQLDASWDSKEDPRYLSKKEAAEADMAALTAVAKERQQANAVRDVKTLMGDYTLDEISQAIYDFDVQAAEETGGDTSDIKKMTPSGILQMMFDPSRLVDIMAGATFIDPGEIDKMKNDAIPGYIKALTDPDEFGEILDSDEVEEYKELAESHPEEFFNLSSFRYYFNKQIFRKFIRNLPQFKELVDKKRSAKDAKRQANKATRAAAKKK